MPLDLDRPAMHNLTDLQRSLELDRIYRKGRLEEPADPAALRTIRIVTWNIERGYQPGRIAEVLGELRPDVACLQEVDWGNERTQSLDVLEYLAERTGMLGLLGVEFLELEAPARSERLRGGGAIGNAVLTRFEPKSAFCVPLPASVDWQRDADNQRLPRIVRWRLSREPRIGMRSGVGMELELARRRIVVCSLHLEDKHGGVCGRWSQYMAAVGDIESRSADGAIRIIAGDFNTFDSRLARLVTGDTQQTALEKPPSQPEAEWWQQRLLPTAGFEDPFQPSDWTFGLTPFFRGKLDWITIKGARVRECGVGPYSVSDHRPLWADIDVQD